MVSASPSIRRADPADPADAHAIGALIDAYAQDPMGGGKPLDPAIKVRLGRDLAAHPTAMVWLAFVGDQPAGIAVCFGGYSTFAGAPLINVHDLAVSPDYRGRSIGRGLLQAVEAHARDTGCCKVTLEVRADNATARALYAALGFVDGDAPMSFWTKKLAS